MTTSETNYWSWSKATRLSRRRALSAASAGALGVVSLSLFGCGGGSNKPAEKKDQKEPPKKKESGNTAAAAAAILEKYTRRQRS